jgi:hypothetical protein
MQVTTSPTIKMEATTSEYDSSLRKARRIGIIFLAYVMVLPLITLILPESTVPVDNGATILSWLLIFLMPIEILLIYGFYHYFGKRFGLANFQALAVLMYVLATAPSIYAFVIGFINSPLRLIATLVGLIFSLTGFWLVLMLLISYQDSSTAYNPE